MLRYNEIVTIFIDILMINGCFYNKRLKMGKLNIERIFEGWINYTKFIYDMCAYILCKCLKLAMLNFAIEKMAITNSAAFLI